MREVVKSISFGGRLVGPNEPVFIVVETGTTCNGKLDTALRMVDAAKEAGADAIKFQMIGPDHFMSDKTVVYEYEWAGGRRSENMYEMFKGLEFRREEWLQIRDYCLEKGIMFYATIDYQQGVDLAEEMGMAAFKVSSWDAANFPLIRRMARTGKPVQLDLGPTTVSDIEKLVNCIAEEKNDQVILVHCSHATTDDGINLRSVPYLQHAFGFPVGYSADSRDFVPDLVAIGLGVHLVEKRLTLDRNYPGHHHIKALEPEEFKEYVAMIRRAESMIGEYKVKPSDEDSRQRQSYFVSVVADTDIPQGAIISRPMLACKRPGTGISPELMEIIVGRTARRDIKRNEMISWDAI